MAGGLNCADDESRKDLFMNTQTQETWKTVTRIGIRAMMVMCILAVIVLAALAFLAELTIA